MLNKKFTLLSLACLFYVILNNMPYFSSFFVPEVLSQDKCETALTLAENEYTLGNWDRVMALLNPCLPDGIPEAKKVRAYELLALAYTLEDSLAEAKNAIAELLNEKSNYEPDDRAPGKFIELVNTEKKIRARKACIRKLLWIGGAGLATIAGTVTAIVLVKGEKPDERLPDPPKYPDNKK